MIHSDIENWPPPKLVRQFHRRVLRLRDLLLRRIEITNRSHSYRFCCGSVRELNRCLKLLSKEPGTVKWIETEMKPGDVFYDVGANIGIFSIYAARHLGPNGRVFAFEPHNFKFVRLVDNIRCNSLEGVVFPCNLPLHSSEGFGYFTYDSTIAGSSNSQFLCTAGNPRGGPPVKGISELKYAAPIDRLIELCRVPAPHHVKIDIDGNELEVLRGMRRLLESPQRPRSLQIELDANQREAIIEFLKGLGYRLTDTHYTCSASRRVVQPSLAPVNGCNGLFHPD
jgi:FkbM family methyltransferase